VRNRRREAAQINGVCGVRPLGRIRNDV